MGLTWDELPEAILQAEREERTPDEPGIRTVEQAKLVLYEYHDNGRTYRELLADPRFEEVHRVFQESWNARRGHNPAVQELTRVVGEVGRAALQPLQAMLLHQIEWF